MSGGGHSSSAFQRRQVITTEFNIRRLPVLSGSNRGRHLQQQFEMRMCEQRLPNMQRLVANVGENRKRFHQPADAIRFPRLTVSACDRRIRWQLTDSFPGAAEAMYSGSTRMPVQTVPMSNDATIRPIRCQLGLIALDACHQRSQAALPEADRILCQQAKRMLRDATATAFV